MISPLKSECLMARTHVFVPDGCIVEDKLFELPYIFGHSYTSPMYRLFCLFFSCCCFCENLISLKNRIFFAVLFSLVIVTGCWGGNASKMLNTILVLSTTKGLLQKCCLNSYFISDPKSEL